MTSQTFLLVPVKSIAYHINFVVVVLAQNQLKIDKNHGNTLFKHLNIFIQALWSLLSAYRYSFNRSLITKTNT